MEALKHIWKKMALVALILAGMGYSVDVQAAASKKNVMCVKTNTGHYFPVVRVSMMVVADGASTFEIVLKDGEGEANVESISFEKHEEMIDFELYRLNSDGTPYLDMMKPSWLITSTGKFFKTMDVTNMLANGHILVQRFGDILDGKRTWQKELMRSNLRPTLPDAVAGDITAAMPYRAMINIINFIQAMDQVVPGFASYETLLYSPELKFYSNRIKMDDLFNTSVKGLHCLGDSSGWTRGLMMASVMGVRMGRILAEEE